MERREPVLGDVVFLWDFCISIFDSCPSCLVWSGLILVTLSGIVMFVFMLSYLRCVSLAAF